MFAVCLFDVLCLVLVAGIDQIAVIGEGRPVEGVAVDIIRAYFQAQAAFHALGSGILVGMVFVRGRAVFTDVGIGFLQVFLDGGTVYGQIDDSRELVQGFQHDFITFQIPQEGFTGQGRDTVDDHGAGPAYTLHARAGPGDPFADFALRIDRVIMVIQIVQHPGNGIVFRAAVFKGFPVAFGNRGFLSEYSNFHIHVPCRAGYGKHRHHKK